MKAIAVLVAFILLFILPVSIRTSFAVTQSISLSNLPSTIDQSQEFSLSLSFSCPGCSDSYLRGVFYPSGSSYFGYTKDNNGNWSNAPGSNCTSFFKIAQSDLQTGSWSGVLSFKPDISSSYYNGPGEYSFKVGRYTSSCGSPSTWSNEATIAITGPTPTFSPTNTPTPPQPTSTPLPTPSKTPTVTPSLSPTSVNSPTQSQNSSAENVTNSVLGAQDTNSSNNQNKSEQVKIAGATEHNIIGLIFIVLGILFLVLCGIVVAWNYREAILTKLRR